MACRTDALGHERPRLASQAAAYLPANIAGVILFWFVMLLFIAVAGVADVIAPIPLSAVGQDPAQSSTIVLTTITEITGFFTFLGIVSVLPCLP